MCKMERRYKIQCAPFQYKNWCTGPFFCLNYPRIRGWYQARVHPFSSGNGKGNVFSFAANICPYIWLFHSEVAPVRVATYSPPGTQANHTSDVEVAVTFSHTKCYMFPLLQPTTVSKNLIAVPPLLVCPCPFFHLPKGHHFITLSCSSDLWFNWNWLLLKRDIWILARKQFICPYDEDIF